MSKSFYENGLRFECRRCSGCCRFDPGYVFLTPNDLILLLKATGLPREAFLDEYCRCVDISGFNRLSLKEKKNYDCVFWEENGCRVYEHRPLQCRSYPFWSHHLSSLDNWNKLSQSCPGINGGRYHSRSEIDYWLNRRQQEPLLTCK